MPVARALRRTKHTSNSSSRVYKSNKHLIFYGLMAPFFFFSFFILFLFAFAARRRHRCRSTKQRIGWGLSIYAVYAIFSNWA